MSRVLFIVLLAACALLHAGPPSLPVVYGPFQKSSEVTVPSTLYTWSNQTTPYTVFRVMPDGSSVEVERARNHSDVSWPVRPGETVLKMISKSGQYWGPETLSGFYEVDRMSYLIPMNLPPSTNRIEYRDGTGNWNFYREVVDKATVLLPVEATSSFRVYRSKQL